ncbi:META domain-containing protein [Bauldia sp.]|uniref:META domain-containing protein n=1 Tax=Bauldia sp. TaxID=2575872 RepID=UPI003BA9ED4C
MPRFPVKLIVLVALLLAPMSVAAAADTPLIDTRWMLVSARGEPAEPGRTSAHLIFAADGSVAGNTGCNNLGAVYTLDGDRLSFSPVMTTRMYCAAAAASEHRFVTALPAVAGYVIDGTRLTLTGADGMVLATFTAASA